uniref:uS12 prolyl 3-hydroxylase n=1 Tax=Anopheles christyi TaxID=43041 RepID=A0A182JXQ6_9DIPT
MSAKTGEEAIAQTKASSDMSTDKRRVHDDGTGEQCEAGSSAREDDTPHPPASKRTKRGDDRNTELVSINGCFFDDDFRERFKTAWQRRESSTGCNYELKQEPFQLAVLQNFLQEDPKCADATKRLEKEFSTVDWKRKQMDLYEFYQTNDLCSLKRDYLQAFYTVLKEQMMPLVEELTGIKLTHVSASCSMYNAGDYLLVHDDLLSDRRIAYVFYLSPWDCHRRWHEKDGGALELFKADSNQLPVFPVTNKIYPQNNQLILFRVCENSFHQVGEVTTFEYPRLTINGWFHGPTPPGGKDGAGSQAPSIIIDTHYISPRKIDIDLHEWINDVYLVDEVKQNVQKKVEMFSEVSLEQFLLVPRFTALLESLCTEPNLEWRIKGPAHLRKYEVLNFKSLPDGSALGEMYDLFTSRTMFRLLYDYTELDLYGRKAKTPKCAIELQRWERGCYTVLGDSSTYADSTLDITFYLNAQENVGVITYLVPEGDQKEQEQQQRKGSGSQKEVPQPSSSSSSSPYAECYEEDPVLLTLLPKDNVLNVVYRAEGTTKFTKYVSHNTHLEKADSNGPAYTYILVCSYKDRVYYNSVTFLTLFAAAIHIYATIAFILIIIVIGVPMWWKTTEVYRVSLPYSEIRALDEEPIKAAFRLGLYCQSAERREILSFELRKKFEQNFVFELDLQLLSLDAETVSTIKTPARLEAELQKHYPSSLGHFLFIEWPKLDDDILVTSDRTAFISESASSLKAYQVLSSWLLQEYKLKAILGSRDAQQTLMGRQLRLNSAPLQAQYEVLITVLNPRPELQRVHWNARAAAENYIEPFLNELSGITNFTIKTQWIYQVGLEGAGAQPKQVPDDSKLGRHYALAEDSLPHIITSLEKKLGTQITDNPCIHLVVYVPPCAQAPLRIYRKDGQRASTLSNNVEAFTSAKWGGIVFANPNEATCVRYMETEQFSEVYIHAQDVMPVLLYQLRKIFDLENNTPLLDATLVPYSAIEPRAWEVDTFVRTNTIYLVHSATTTLQSLIQLLGGIEYIVINDEVGAAIQNAYQKIVEAKQKLRAGKLEQAALLARDAYTSAERAFFDPSMLALLYFPDEQKYAIYIPLFLPIMIPVVFSFNTILKYFRKRMAATTAVKAKEDPFFDKAPSSVEVKKCTESLVLVAKMLFLYCASLTIHRINIVLRFPQCSSCGASVSAMDKEHEVLLNAFVIAKKRYRVFYNAGILVWEDESSKKAKITVPITDVLSVAVSKHPHANGKQWMKRSKAAPPAPSPPPAGAIARNEAHGSLDSDRIPVLSGSTTTNTLATNATINNVPHNHSNGGSLNELSDDDHRETNDYFDAGIQTGNFNYLIIHYAAVVCVKTNRWRVRSVALYNSEHRLVELWYNRLSSDLRDQNRPKNLLLFLNPYGGKKNALALYERFAKPLFRLAEVDINLIITQRAQQIYDIVTSKSIVLDNYDGLVCCGGDGTFAELFNGLVTRTMLDRGIDIKRPSYLPKPNIPIGVIPAGSTDTVACCLNGTTDIKTSIIHIILGQHSGLDISAVYNAEAVARGDEGSPSETSRSRPQLLKLFASALSYGYLGDIAYDSEKYRWMGPKRYDYSGFKKFLANRGYNAEIVVHLDRRGKQDPNDGVRCLDKCNRCKKAQLGRDSGVERASFDDDDTEPLVVRGKFLMVSGANISCSCERSPQGFSPYCHLGDGLLDLVLVRHTSMFNNLRLLLTMTSKTKKLSELPFVEIYRTKEFRFTANGQSESSGGEIAPAISSEAMRRSKWNCDGEVLLDTNIIVETNCQLVQVFRRGILASGCTGNNGLAQRAATNPLSIDEKESCCFGLCN